MGCQFVSSLGVPVTKKMEDSQREGALKVERIERRGMFVGEGGGMIGRGRSKSLLAVTAAVARRSSYYLR